MRKIALALLASAAVACGTQESTSSGTAQAAGAVHRASGRGLTAQAALDAYALTSIDPVHSVPRDTTTHDYCVQCHVGYDGANSHPVGVSEEATAAAFPGQYFFPPARLEVVLVSGTMIECTACHDDGSAGLLHRLVLDSGEALCVACHNLGSDTPPAVAITSPGAGAAVSGTISVEATASDNYGVVNAQLFTGPTPYSAGTLVASAVPSGGLVALPFDTTATENGPLYLTVRATDTAGQVGYSTRTVTIANPVDAPPSVSITSPAAGATVGGTIQVVATVTDDVGVTDAALFVGSIAVVPGVLSGDVATFTLDTTQLPDGSLSLVVRAIDGSGQAGAASVPVSIDNTAPSVAITSPASGSVVRGSVTISATASDASGVDRVEFYVDGALLSTSTAAPYAVIWTPARRSGTRTLTARAFDVLGNEGASAPVTVQVK